MSASKTTIEGHRQITALHVPGDMPDLHGLHLGVHDSDARTLTDRVVATMDHEPLRRLCAEQPRLAAEPWRIALVDAGILREWTVSLGRRSEVARMAHLLGKMMLRLSAVSQRAGGRGELPLTSVELGESLGLSTVQVDHVLQEPGQVGLASFREGWLATHDWVALQASQASSPTTST